MRRKQQPWWIRIPWLTAKISLLTLLTISLLWNVKFSFSLGYSLDEGKKEWLIVTAGKWVWNSYRNVKQVF